MCVALALARVCMKDMTNARVKMECKKKTSTFQVYFPIAPPAIVFCSYAFVYYVCLRSFVTCVLPYVLCLYVSVCYSCVLVCYQEP